MAASVNSDVKLELVLSSGNKIQIVPDLSGFFTVNLVQAGGQILDTEGVDQATSLKFQQELNAFNMARIAQLRVS